MANTFTTSEQVNTHTHTNRGLSINPGPFLYKLTMKKLVKKWHMRDQLQLSATILAQWRHLVASNKALNLLYRAMRAVLYRRTVTAIEMASLYGTVFCRYFVCCCSGGRWGNTEQVVAQWRHAVASGVALDMLHQAMPSVLLRRTVVAIETASG